VKNAVSILVLLGSLSLPTFAYPESSPSPSQVDPRVRYLTYQRDEVYRLPVSPSRVMTIVLDPSESIASLQAGDTESWQIELLESGNVIVIKLQDEAGATNLTAISDSGRIYSFDMMPVTGDLETADNLVYRVHFNYPDASFLAEQRREKAERDEAERLRLEQMQREIDAQRRADDEAARQRLAQKAIDEENRARRLAQIQRQTAAHQSERAHKRELERIAAERETQLTILREQQALEYARLQQETNRAEAARQAAEAARLAEEARLREAERINSPTLLFDDGRPSIVAANSRGNGTQNQQRRLSDNELFIASSYEAEFPTSTGSVLPRQDRLVAQGTIIQAILESAVNSDLPGMIRGIVNEDVYAFDGAKIMIPKGARLIGRYSSNIQLGQERVVAVWTRLIRPDGVSIALGSPTSDDLGLSGIGGNVDTHFREKFGSAALISVMTGIAGYGSSRIRDEAGREIAENIGNDFTGQASGAFERYLSLAPTVRADQGSRVSVFVARDLYL